jgi:hypothetical protein
MKEDIKEETPASGFKIKNLQEILYVCYLTLLLFGLIRETITYGILGINIISYSSVLDILLSPVVILTSSLVLTCGLVMGPILFYIGLEQIAKFKTRNKDKQWYQKCFGVAKVDENKKEEDLSLILVITMTYGMLFGAFLSISIGDGYELKEEIEAGTQEMTHTLTFEDKEVLPVKIIGQNSQYIFYVLDKDTEIAISPIEGNIKRIQKLKELK